MMNSNRGMSGYPSIDKPWLKYYSEEAIHAPLPKCTIFEYLWQNNKDHLDEIALIFFGKKITYKQLFENIDRTANAFKAIGVKENDIVTVLMLNQPEMVYTFYALNKIGAVTCVVNVLSSPKELVHYLQEGDSKYFVVLDIFFDKAYEAAKKYGVNNLIYVPMYESLGPIKMTMYRMKVPKPLCSDDFVLSWEDFIKSDISNSIELVHYEDGKCTVIGHTGGTTGVPKGVMLTDQAFNAIIAQYRYKFVYTRQETFLNMIVPFAIYGLLINLHMPLTLGVTVILIPKVDPATTDRLLQKHKPNHVASIPGYWNTVAENKKKADWSFLKTAAAGGAGMTVQLEQKLNQVFIEGGAKIHFTNGYGMSEVCGTACTQTSDCAEIGSVGIPLVQNVLAAFDVDTLEEKKYGELGEICILSPSMMLGYVNNPEETTAVMKKHLDGRVWLHTGDLGFISESGSVYIKGRIKRIYITQQNGTVSKIFPDRIEKTICIHPDVAECCVVCIPASEASYLPVANVILCSNCSVSIQKIEQDLRELCQRELPEYAHPAAYRFCKAFPITAVGKVDYKELEKVIRENARKENLGLSIH